MAGGTPQLVLKSGPGYWYPRCAVSPAKLCVIAEQSEDGKPIIFTGFDALKGRGQELARFETEPGAAYNFALSPEGTRIAILKDHSGEARIHTLFLNGQADGLQPIQALAPATGIAKSFGGVGVTLSFAARSRPCWRTVV